MAETKLDTQNVLKDLLDGKPYYASLDSNIVYPEIFNSKNTIFSFLVMTGYLKAKRHYLNETYYDYELRIPNKEISIAYKSEIIQKLSMEHVRFSDYTTDFMRAVYGGDAYRQIIDKNYDAELRKRNVKPIYKYGVAFYKKSVSVYG